MKQKKAMKKHTALKKKRVICIVLACVLLGGTVSVGLIAHAPEDISNENIETTVSPVIRWSYTDADDVFEKEFDKFNTLIADVSNAIAYYDDHDFTTIEDIKTYEAMWQNLAGDAKAIQTALTEKRPPKEYEDAWDGFADCMGQISDAFAEGMDLSTGHGDIIADWIHDTASEFETLSQEAFDFANDLVATSATIKTDYFFLQIYNSEDQLVTQYKVTLTGMVSSTSREITSVTFDLVSGDVCETNYEIDGDSASVMITHPTEGFLLRSFTLSASGVFSAE